MTPPTALRFVHFSDIHFGQERPEELPRHEDVREEVIRDCRRMVEEGLVDGSANAILITGDIAYSGKEPQFKAAGDWIDRVADAVGCGPRDVLMIPGNHDVDRSKLGYYGEHAQNRLRGLDLQQCATELEKALTEDRNPLAAKFEDYLSFAEAYGCAFKSARRPVTSTDFPLSGGKSIRFVGLCSVLISDGADRPGNMFLGEVQYRKIRRDDAVEQMVMIHHPLEWFMDVQSARPFVNQRARLLLTGHEHLAEFTVKTNHADFQQLHLAAGATNPDRTSHIFNFTYNWLEFSWVDRNGRRCLSVRVHPRAWNPVATHFDPDYNRAGPQGFKEFYLDCGSAEATSRSARDHAAAAGHKPVEPLLAPREDGHRVAEDEMALDASVTSGAENVMASEAPDHPHKEEPSELLKFLFWRHLDRQNRQAILKGLELLPGNAALVPHAFEVAAFERAFEETSKARALWDAAMAAIPEAHRHENPYTDEG